MALQVLFHTSFDVGKPIEDLSFEIDNITFSHHTSMVVQMSKPVKEEAEDPIVKIRYEGKQNKTNTPMKN